jgi:hypothetical protein
MLQQLHAGGRDLPACGQLQLLAGCNSAGSRSFFPGEMGLQAVLIMLQPLAALLPFASIILPCCLAGLHGQRQGMVMVVGEWGKGCAAFHGGAVNGQADSLRYRLNFCLDHSSTARASRREALSG